MNSGKKPNFIRKHEYPGGKKAFQEFLKTHLTYPQEALKNNIEGFVFLEYQVGFEGKVNQVKVLKGIGYGCDEEAVRLIRLLQFAPQNNHGVKLISTHKIKIQFKLPETKESIKISYSINENKAKETKPEKASYSYTIKF
jgi:TonB family protein